MRIYLFKTNSQIETATLKKIAIFISRILGINYYVEENSLGEVISVEDLQSIANRYLVEKKMPLVGVLYTLHNITQKESTLGIAFCRVALIRYDSKDFKKLVIATLHELGHLFDADHCKSNYCLMYPEYQPMPIDNIIFRELLCSRCFAVISHSWVYRLLTKEGRLKNYVKSGL